MVEARRVLTPCLALLALSACAQAEGDKDKRGPAPPLGVELAMAQDNASSSSTVAQSESSVLDLSPAQLRAKVDAGNIRLIDVRTDAEVAEGIIPGAEHIALDQFDPATLDLDDGREVVLYCRSGRRSGLAAERLAAHIGQPAPHLEGGILAWDEAGEPVELP